jgi:D-glycero-beta-D-manno-heptose 1-phosphate adenylyltransferase
MHDFSGILGRSANCEARIFHTVEDALPALDALRTLQQKIVVTSGSFDLFHPGHGRYLELAKALGNVLVVGVDSDEKIKKRKGPNRPVVPEDERMTILALLRSVDIVILKNASDAEHSFLKVVRPDVLVISETSGHDEGKIAELNKIAGEVVLLEAQSDRGTTARLRLMMFDGMGKLGENIQAAIPGIVEHTLHEISQKKGVSP